MASDNVLIEKKVLLKTIGRIVYDRNEILGNGAFAFVFSGTFCDGTVVCPPVAVAVKRLQLGDVNTDEREVTALEKLKDHPHILQFYGAENDDDFNYFALELCVASMDAIFLPDDNPKKYKGPLPSDLDVLLQLSEGLRFIHKNGFVHRDVKPGNVLISYPSRYDGTVVMKWADFGLSKSVSSGGTFTVTGQGTTNWIAPEILAILGDEPLRTGSRGTVESDTWSFGCVVFAYLTKGKHPFGEKLITANILNNKPINLTALPSDHFAFNIVKEMIQAEPKNRMKLSDVVEILDKLKIDSIMLMKETLLRRREEQDATVRGELEADQLYSWKQWNLTMKERDRDRDRRELIVWSDDVVIDRISDVYDVLPIKLNEADKLEFGSLDEDGLRTDKDYDKYKATTTIEPAREEGELKREMLETFGFQVGSPSRSPRNTHFVSSACGMEWKFYISELDDKLIIKIEERSEDVDSSDSDKRSSSRETRTIILFGPLFHSTFHVKMDDGDIVCCMTNRAKVKMERELLDLCSSPNPKPEDLQRIASLLHAGVNPNCTNTEGETLLFICLKKPDEEIRLKILEILLKGNQSRRKRSVPKPVDLNVKDLEGKNAFELLLDDFIERRRTRFPPLSTESGPIIFQLLEILIKAGIDVKSQGEYGQRILHILCEHFGKENIVEAMAILIEKGVDVNLKDDRGRTALHFLCENYENENIVDAMKILIEKGVDVNSNDKKGWNALHLLCENSKNENIVDAMKFLIEKGVDVNLKGPDGPTALHLVGENYKKEKIFDTMKFFVEKLFVSLKDKWEGLTALHLLCENSKNENIVDAMEFLIEKGVDVNLKGPDGPTALHLLCEHYKKENTVHAMMFAIQKAADACLKGPQLGDLGRTALHLLCGNSKNENIVDAMKLLIDKGVVNVNDKDNYGQTVLHYLCGHYKGENIVGVMTFFIEKGVDVQLKDRYGSTALHLLCGCYKQENIVDAMRILIENGVNVNLKDEYGRTALDYLAKDPKEKITEILNQ